MDEEKEYCCKDCGSEEIMWSAYIDENDNVVDIDGKHTDVWCNSCSLFCEYISKKIYYGLKSKGETRNLTF